MISVRAINGFEPHRGPWCSFEIDTNGLSRRNLADRREMAERKGIDPGICGKPAQVVIEGRHYCRAHAGETLLRDHIGPATGRARRGW